jgi:hypothetical protein
MLLMAVDPGLRAAGVSVFDDGELVLATLAIGSDETGRGPEAWVSMATAIAATFPLAPDVLVVELMQVYPGGTPADDLMQVTGVTGALAAMYPNTRIEGYKAREWTGGVPKKERQAAFTMTEAEWSVVDSYPKALMHNVVDSLMLGKWRLAKENAKVLYTEAA